MVKEKMYRIRKCRVHPCGDVMLKMFCNQQQLESLENDPETSSQEEEKPYPNSNFLKQNFIQSNIY